MPAPTLLESTPFGDSPFAIQHWRFANGLTLLLVEDPGAPVFAWQTWFDVGSCNEQPALPETTTSGFTSIRHPTLRFPRRSAISG